MGEGPSIARGLYTRGRPPAVGGWRADLLFSPTGAPRRRGPPKPNDMSQLVLIVDDEPGIQTALAGILADEGFATVCTGSGSDALSLYHERRPDVVFLDIWLPDRDGLETLQALRQSDPTAAVIMMSGHGTAATAVKAIKMGAYDYLEKPLSYNRAVEAVSGALSFRSAIGRGNGAVEALELSKGRFDGERELRPPPALPMLRPSAQPQRTLRRGTVLYGLGLHSGSRTGMALQPLPPDSGIQFVTLPTGTLIPAHVDAVADTDYATTLAGEGESIRTVEHLLSALHAYGVTNLLVKVHGEIPVLDGSALEFCKTLEEIGLEEQAEPRRELVIDRRFEVNGGEKSLAIEPYDGFAVSYFLRYPPPVGEQSYEFICDRPGALQAGDRAGPHLRLHARPQDDERAGPRLGGPARQLHPGRRGRGAQHRAALPRRVRAPQDPRHHRRPLPARASPSAAR